MKHSQVLVLACLIASGCVADRSIYPDRPTLHTLGKQAREEQNQVASDDGLGEIIVWTQERPRSIDLPVMIGGIEASEFLVESGELFARGVSKKQWVLTVNRLPDMNPDLGFRWTVNDKLRRGSLIHVPKFHAWTDKVFAQPEAIDETPSDLFLGQRFETLTVKNQLHIPAWAEIAYVRSHKGEWRVTYGSRYKIAPSVPDGDEPFKLDDNMRRPGSA